MDGRLEHEIVEHAADSPYTPHDAARIVEESQKAPWRTAFERDRARLVHSAALRRLGAKTQVMGPGSDDFVRTRLTHSLEVAQVGRELGAQLGCNPDVVDAACLSHDIGHPPFGHNGERALNEVAAEIGGFEGNAQTLRILTRLEAKRQEPFGGSIGLNLTRATLDATCKYPWAAGEGPALADGAVNPKFGVYEDDLRVFEWVREGAPEGRRSLEAQVMDLSDDVAYSVHDVEDGIAGGRIDPVTLPAHLDAVVDSTLEWYGGFSRDEVGAAIERVISSPLWPGEFERSRAGLAALKNMTSALIGRFCRSAHVATREVAGDGRLARYGASLEVPRETEAEILGLKGMAVHFVMQPREHEPLYLTQRTVIFDLVDALLEAGAGELELEFQGDFAIAETESDRLRVVVDQVASLTDTSAHAWHARLCGMFSSVY
ncbi:MAG: deoxyguanosinetriphosphate triphosphohydrolase [bacterium]|nr:deoxyguanosinetriphosphate triphosphohydrolase [bacterium]